MKRLFLIGLASSLLVTVITVYYATTRISYEACYINKQSKEIVKVVDITQNMVKYYTTDAMEMPRLWLKATFRDNFEKTDCKLFYAEQRITILETRLGRIMNYLFRGEEEIIE